MAKKQIELSDLDGYSWDWWAKYGEEVVKELAAAFSAALTFDLPDAPPAEVQRFAAMFAERRGARLLRLDGPENLVRLTRERVNVLVADTLANGESLGTLAKNIRADVAFSRERAKVVARTESATALGQGSKESAIMQGRDEKHWVTQGDALVSEECQANETAGWIPIADSFPSGVDTVPQHPNCLLPGNRVIAPQIISASRVFYHGKAIELTTENGDRLAVTPNHMILTPSEFKKVKFLREGDYIIGSQDAQRIGACINPDDDYSPTPIEQIWDSLMVAQGVVTRFVPTSAMDFHGDAGGFQGQVHIIDTNGFLWNQGGSALHQQHFGEEPFSFGNAQLFKFSGFSPAFFFRDGLIASRNGFMGRGSQGLSLGGRQTPHTDITGFTSATGFDARLEEMAAENIPAYTQLASQFQLRFAGLITQQKLVKIREFNFSGYVYDLQTLEQLYISNNIIVKNCRCVTRYRTKALHGDSFKPGRHKTCGKLLITSKTPGRLWCRFCKVEV